MTDIDSRRKLNLKTKKIKLVIFTFLVQPTSKVSPLPPYLDLDSLAAEFYQIFKQIEIMPGLHTCNRNVLIEGERNIL